MFLVRLLSLTSGGTFSSDFYRNSFTYFSSFPFSFLLASFFSFPFLDFAEFEDDDECDRELESLELLSLLELLYLFYKSLFSESELFPDI
jgi:hypothetical protein